MTQDDHVLLQARRYANATFVLLAAACSAPAAPIETEDSISESVPKLYRETDEGNYWATSTVTYCYQAAANAPDSGSVAWSNTVTETERALRAWASVPDTALTFSGGGTCGDSADSSTLRILISSIAGGQTRIGDEGTVIEFGLGSDLNFSRATILHEVGHALGFAHEYRRGDRTEDRDAPVGGAVRCSAATNFVALDPADGAAVCEERSWINTPQDDDEVVTVYDPLSVMNSTYCHCRSELSQLDRAGVAFVYPSSAPKLHTPFSFAIRDSLVLGGDVIAAHQAAGVHPRWFQGMTWNVTQGETVSEFSGPTLFVEDFASGAQVSMAATYTNPRGLPQRTARTRFILDRGLAAAFTMAIL